MRHCFSRSGKGSVEVKRDFSDEALNVVVLEVAMVDAKVPISPEAVGDGMVIAGRSGAIDDEASSRFAEAVSSGRQEIAARATTATAAAATVATTTIG